jgi:hypothetical protein
MKHGTPSRANRGPKNPGRSKRLDEAGRGNESKYFITEPADRGLLQRIFRIRQAK